MLAALCLLAPTGVALMAATAGSPSARRRVAPVHAAVQVCVVVAVAAGLPLGVLLPVAGPTPHKVTGYVALVLVAATLAGAACRPPPGAGAHRAAWTWAHRCTGLAALALAAVSAGLGAARTHMSAAWLPGAFMGVGAGALVGGYVWGGVARRRRGAGGMGSPPKNAAASCALDFSESSAPSSTRALV